MSTDGASADWAAAGAAAPSRDRPAAATAPAALAGGGHMRRRWRNHADLATRAGRSRSCAGATLQVRCAAGTGSCRTGAAKWRASRKFCICMVHVYAEVSEHAHQAREARSAPQPPLGCGGRERRQWCAAQPGHGWSRPGRWPASYPSWLPSVRADEAGGRSGAAARRGVGFALGGPGRASECSSCNVVESDRTGLRASFRRDEPGQAWLGELSMLLLEALLQASTQPAHHTHIVAQAHRASRPSRRDRRDLPGALRLCTLLHNASGCQR